MKEICLAFKVITPMFSAGANGQRAELRPPSVKGVLRFWWRATQVGLGLKQLQEKEGEIFGSAREKENKKSSFSLAIKTFGLDRFRSFDPLPGHKYPVKNFPANILEYLAYGTCEWSRQEKRNVFTREYIKPDCTFELVLRIWEEKNRAEIFKALQAFYLFGGLGSKTRNGFGGLEVISASAEGEQEVKALSSLTPDDVFKGLCSFNGDPSFPAFSKHARLFKTKKQFPTWDACLAELGLAYRNARLSLEKLHNYSRRRYIGAPIVVNKQQESHLDRHAKPYFLRVYKQSNGYTGYILYLPADYLPRSYCDRLGIAQGKYKELNWQQENNNFTSACKDLNGQLAGELKEVK